MRLRRPAGRTMPMQLPPLYPITDVRAQASLPEQIRRLGAAGFPLVQFRGKPLDAGRQGAELATALRGIEVPWNPSGLMLLSVGNVLVLGLAWAIIHDPQAIARTVFELLDMK